MVTIRPHFWQIFEPIIIDSNKELTIDYWYWNQINVTTITGPPFIGSAKISYQNSQDYENASMAAFDDIIIIANGQDYPQKFDGQTVYRTGMPQGVRVPTLSDNTTFFSQPFTTGNIYQYAITYEQIDNRGHIVEGEIGDVRQYTVMAASRRHQCDSDKFNAR